MYLSDLMLTMHSADYPSQGQTWWGLVCILTHSPVWGEVRTTSREPKQQPQSWANMYISPAHTSAVNK